MTEIDEALRFRVRAAFTKAPTVRGAARVLEVAERTLYRWLRADPSLARAGVDRAARGRERLAQSQEDDNGSVLTHGSEMTPSPGGWRAVLAAGGSVADAARAAGVHERTVRRWADKYSVAVRRPGRPGKPITAGAE